MKGNSTFAKHETTVASLKKYTTTGLEEIPDSNLLEIKVYPNSFSDEVTVEIKLEADTKVQVEVLNKLGQHVKYLQKEKMMNSGIRSIHFGSIRKVGSFFRKNLFASFGILILIEFPITFNHHCIVVTVANEPYAMA